jgi:hypothetical protein
MVNQVQVILCVLLVVMVAGGVKLGNDASLKCTAVAPEPPASAELPRVEVVGAKRVARAHQPALGASRYSRKREQVYGRWCDSPCSLCISIRAVAPLRHVRTR